METDAHQRLKRMAVGFLREQGCRAVATEVSCPIARYRVDVAGYQDRPAATVLIECKQDRADYMRDRRDADRLVELRRELEAIRRSIEERRIKRHEPHLRRSGSSLFPELETWDFSRSRLAGYRRLLRRIRDIELRLCGETKFFMIARYHLADRLYLAAPYGMVQPRELPGGWGLLECAPRTLRGGGGALRVTVEAPPRASRPQHRVRLLRNIAVAASRTVLAGGEA